MTEHTEHYELLQEILTGKPRDEFNNLDWAMELPGYRKDEKTGRISFVFTTSSIQKIYLTNQSSFGEYCFDEDSNKVFHRWDESEEYVELDYGTEEYIDRTKPLFDTFEVAFVGQFTATAPQRRRVVEDVANTKHIHTHSDRLRSAYDYYLLHKGEKIEAFPDLDTENVNEHILEYEFGTTNSFYNKQFRFWLALAARHIMSPMNSYPIRYTLPIISDQQMGKTVFIEWLTFHDYGIISNISNVAQLRVLANSMFAWAEEGAMFNGAKYSDTKTFITQAKFDVDFKFEGSRSYKNRYLIITSNTKKFFKDNQNTRFPFIEISEEDIRNRRFDRTDLTPELRQLVWGQAVHDWKSGWLEANEAQMTERLKLVGDETRDWSDDQEALMRVLRLNMTPFEFYKADTNDIVERSFNSIGNGVNGGDFESDTYIPYIRLKNVRDAINQLGLNMKLGRLKENLKIMGYQQSEAKFDFDQNGKHDYQNVWKHKTAE